MADNFALQTVQSDADLDAVRRLCWAYRHEMLALSDRDRRITETFYKLPDYQRLMADLPVLHARPNGAILLARLPDGTLAGCSMTQALNTDMSEIKRVFVLPVARRKGLASRICRGLLDQARMDGFKTAVLDTSLSMTSTQKLYETLGFRRRPPYQPVPDDVADDLVYYEKTL